MGDEDGTADVAAEFDLRHEPELARNEFGTPLINDIFARAERLATHDVLCYVNADIILMQDFARAVERVTSAKRRFLMVGHRWNVDVTEPLDYSAPDWEAKLRAHVRENGELYTHWGIDYFVFPRGLFGPIPPFAIGRSAWDNWLLYRARRRWTPVVDATQVMTAVHQNHGYGRSGEGKEAVWESPDGRRNRELAMGHVFNLEDATHMLQRNGLLYNWSPLRVIRHLASFSPLLRPVEKLYGRRLYYQLMELSYPIRAPLGLSRSARKSKELS